MMHVMLQGGISVRERACWVEEFLLLAESWISTIDAMPEEDACRLEEISKRMVAKPGLKANDTSAVKAKAQRLRIAVRGLKYPVSNEEEMYTERFRSIYAAGDNAEVLLRRIEFGTNLRSWRTERGLKVRELASRAEVDPGYVSRLENFFAGPASVEVATRIARTLNITTSELWDGYPPSLDANTEAIEVACPEKVAIIAEIVDLCEEIPNDQLRLLAVALRAVADSEKREKRKQEQRDLDPRVTWA